ncbi:HNH endonuclease [Microbacterium sp. ASV81]|uniref:HNH endonuclease n=1 Tax=Microbacterium capsulatum TaxID=3041921 RepID=A0ABU0XBP2_9MICO|nr:HNH endonuclease [Microbacterium sp. ASV81]MDQ4212528.1 HNH endonuclease [Microbacterium sp. ASV81]
MESPFVVEVPHSRYFIDDHCANCLTALPLDAQGLYCSTWCQEIAAQVRYLRRVFRDGRIHDPDVQLAVQTKNAFLLVGGYRSLGRNLTPRLRAEIRLRDNGRCQQCGKPGVEVDHIAGSADDADNLQLLCLDCHHAKTAEHMVPASDESRALLVGMMDARVAPPEPQLLADDENAWNGLWRTLQARRKERFLDLLRAEGLRINSKDTHFDRVLAYLDATALPPAPGGVAPTVRR